MKIAIVCDDLVQMGGQERVILAFHEAFPDAPVYTSMASARWMEKCKDLKIDLRTSFMQKFPLREKLVRYYSTLLFQIAAYESFDLSEYDVVLSSSSRFSHGVITKPGTKHICYMHSPGRMFWEPEMYFENETFGILKPLRSLAGMFLSIPLSIMRLWDRSAVSRIDVLVANSLTSQARISKYYRRDSHMIHPFTDLIDLSGAAPVSIGDTPGDASRNKGYYLVITRLVPWKRVDIAVRSCMELGLELKVIGEGPDLKRLQDLVKEYSVKSASLANGASLSNRSSLIEFLGYVPEAKKIRMLAGCKALIQTQKEDFGIVPLEALSYGKPVIAYGQGGVLETVEPGVTGEFFMEQDHNSLSQTLREFRPEKYDPAACIRKAREFDRMKFLTNVKDLLNIVYLSDNATVKNS
jgi:glycosyltransferase involved in cell wall biosynthesis